MRLRGDLRDFLPSLLPNTRNPLNWLSDGSLNTSSDRGLITTQSNLFHSQVAYPKPKSTYQKLSPVDIGSTPSTHQHDLSPLGLH